MKKRVMAFAVALAFMLTLVPLAFANSNVELDTETLLYTGNYEGDKTVLLADNFDDPVNSCWTNNNFSVETDYETGNNYGHIVSSANYFIEFGIVANGKMIVEFDYRAPNSGTKTMYLDDSRNQEFSRMTFQDGKRVKIGRNSNSWDIEPDEWHHIKWGLDLDNGTQTVYIDDEGCFSCGLKTYEFMDIRRIAFCTSCQYLDFDNFEIYTINPDPVYTINGLNYSTGNTYPTANAVINSVNVTMGKEKEIPTSLMVAVYDEENVIQSVTSQAVNSEDFTEGIAKTVALTNPVTLPADYNWNWKIGTFIWNDESIIPMAVKYDDNYNVKIEGPVTRAVFQRDENNIGSVELTGKVNADDVVALEARAVVAEDAMSGTDVDWTALDYESGSKAFDSVFSVPAGGWYTIDVRAKLNNGEYLDVASVEKIGVGEVFLTTGQSNSTNHGGENSGPGFRLTRAKYDTISMYDVVDGEWAFCHDPLFNPYNNASKTGITGSSPWPTFANEMMRFIEVPIGIINIGRGSQTIGSWDPDNTRSDMYQRTVDALNTFGENGVRAVLFHQGENNDKDNPATAKENYQATFEKFLSSLRSDIGWNVPFVIANIGTHGASEINAETNEPTGNYIPTIATEQIRAAQQAVCENDPYSYLGPDTDTLVGKDENGNWYRNNNGSDVHFSYTGIVAHGTLWAKKVLPLFFGIDWEEEIIPDKFLPYKHQYAWIVDAYAPTAEDATSLKLFTQSGDMKIYPLADTVKVMMPTKDEFDEVESQYFLGDVLFTTGADGININGGSDDYNIRASGTQSNQGKKIIINDNGYYVDSNTTYASNRMVTVKINDDGVIEEIIFPLKRRIDDDTKEYTDRQADRLDVAVTTIDSGYTGNGQCVLGNSNGFFPGNTVSTGYKQNWKFTDTALQMRIPYFAYELNQAGTGAVPKTKAIEYTKSDSTTGTGYLNQYDEAVIEGGNFKTGKGNFNELFGTRDRKKFSFIGYDATINEDNGNPEANMVVKIDDPAGIESNEK